MQRCFGRTMKSPSDCDDLCQLVLEVRVVNSGFKRWWLKDGEYLEGNSFVLLHGDLFNVLGSQVHLVRNADDFMFRAECCDEYTSRHCHESSLLFS